MAAFLTPWRAPRIPSWYGCAHLIRRSYHCSKYSLPHGVLCRTLVLDLLRFVAKAMQESLQVCALLHEPNDDPGCPCPWCPSHTVPGLVPETKVKEQQWWPAPSCNRSEGTAASSWVLCLPLPPAQVHGEERAPTTTKGKFRLLSHSPQDPCKTPVEQQKPQFRQWLTPKLQAEGGSVLQQQILRKPGLRGPRRVG